MPRGDGTGPMGKGLLRQGCRNSKLGMGRGCNQSLSNNYSSGYLRTGTLPNNAHDLENQAIQLERHAEELRKRAKTLRDNSTEG